MSDAVEEKIDTAGNELVQVLLRDKGVVNPFHYGVVTFTICKKADLALLENDSEILEKFPVKNNGKTEEMCMNTPVQYYIMSCLGASLEDGLVNISIFKRKLEQIYFMFRFMRNGPNIKYEASNVSILPPVGVYFLGILSAHVYGNEFDTDLLYMHLNSHFFEENLKKIGFLKT